MDRAARPGQKDLHGYQLADEYVATARKEYIVIYPHDQARAVDDGRNAFLATRAHGKDEWEYRDPYDLDEALNLSLRSVGTFGPGWRQRIIEIVGFSAPMGGCRHENLWAHDLTDFTRLGMAHTL